MCLLFITEVDKAGRWARNHYLSSAALPSIKGDKLIVPHESLDISIERLKEHGITTKKSSQNLKKIGACHMSISQRCFMLSI
ncbi:hypothetical protein ZEAMMB73_Zm00001d021451 [Zea mays]|uniref:Uncharacterized protein n=1 Tax=Zea mays TaxID=4577 RepID=A0A1D6IB57_MAIZE|nr:hypothetical protein ZEAMMB73_Zm00001d021451 [Zea mays]